MFNIKAITGTSISLYGAIYSSNVSSIATYQIDDRAPVGFDLSGAPATEGEVTTSLWSNQLLFNTSNLAVGEHTVVVAYNGSSAGPPLTIGYFLVTSLTASEQESLGAPGNLTSTPTPTPTVLMSTKHSPTHTVPVIGVALGAVLPTLLLIAMTMLWYRRKMKHKRELALSATSPFHFEDMKVPDGKFGENILTLSTAPVVNPGEVDFSFDVLCNI